MAITTHPSKVGANKLPLVCKGSYTKHRNKAIPTVNISFPEIMSSTPRAAEAVDMTTLNVFISFPDLLKAKYTYSNQELLDIKSQIEDMPLSANAQQGLIEYKALQDSF